VKAGQGQADLRPTKAGAKAKERLVMQVCLDRLGNPGVNYAEAGGDRS
jgi:hypothetical protein